MMNLYYYISQRNNLKYPEIVKQEFPSNPEKIHCYFSWDYEYHQTINLNIWEKVLDTKNIYT